MAETNAVGFEKSFDSLPYSLTLAPFCSIVDLFVRLLNYTIKVESDSE